MAEFSRYIPDPIPDLDTLFRMLKFWNEEICQKEMQGKSCIYSVVIGTENDDEEQGEGRNIVWFKDADTPPLPPEALAEFSADLTPEARRQGILEYEDAHKLKLLSAAIVLFAGGVKKWVALFTKPSGAPAAVAPAAPAAAETKAGAASAALGSIGADHQLSTAKKRPIGTGAPLEPRFVVIHYTEGYLAESSISGWNSKNDGILAHVIVDRDGTIYQCRPFDQKCQHAGDSRTRDPKTDRLFNGMNSYSIGIEIANTGMKEQLHRKLGRGGPYPDGSTVNARHRNGSKGSKEAAEGREWEVFPKAQLDAVFALVTLLMKEYNLQDITGHDCIAPERKADPGPAFPMQALREANGLSGLPKVWDQQGRQVPV